MLSNSLNVSRRQFFGIAAAMGLACAFGSTMAFADDAAKMEGEISAYSREDGSGTRGAFIELTPNLAGLAEYRSDVTQGQAAAVYIKSLIPEKMKVKLVIVDPYRGIPPKPLPHSFLPEDTLHIHRWRYSPDCCDRVIESVFDKNEE